MAEPERLIPWYVISSSFPDEENESWDILDNRNLDNAIDEEDDSDFWGEDDDLE